MLKVTTIQFFDQTFTNQISEFEFEEIRSYSANIAIDDSFIVQLSGNDSSCEVSIPSSNEMSWNDAASQDQASDSFSVEDVEQFLSSQGIENNYDWLKENANEEY